MKAAVTVPREVLQALMMLRAFGQSHMSDIAAAVTFLANMGDVEATAWIRSNPALYYEGLTAGFRPESGRSESL